MNLRTLFRFALAASALLTGAQAQMPLTLFNGTTLAGWNTHGTWLPSAGVLASNGSGNRQILSVVPFADFTLSFDYNEAAGMEAKLRLWAPKEGSGGILVDLDSSASQGPGGVEGGSSSRASAAPDNWHHVQIEASRGGLQIKLDGGPAGSLNGSNTRAGYLGWEASGNGNFQLRSIKLTVNGLTQAFNGSDLGNWKSIARGPESSGGVGHKMEKLTTFGIAGGSTKSHPAKWNVQGSALHGEDGPGGLEYGTQVEDVILQVVASTKSQPKADHFISLTLRNAAGQLDGGYPVGIGPFSGSIENLAKKNFLGSNTNVEETIVLAGRTTAIWVNGSLATVYTDSRAEGPKVGQGARTAGGVMTLVLPGDGVQVNVPRLAIVNLPKNYGSSAMTAAPAPVAQTTAPAAVAAPAGPSATEKAMLEQQQNTAKQADQDRETKQRVAGLMAQALSAQDPQQQMQLYNQVVQLDPSNAPAVQGYKDAQTKVMGAQAAQQQAAAQTVTQEQNKQSKDEQVNASLVKSQSAFLAGRMSDASASLAVAERLAPDNPLVRDLRQRISGASSLHSRLFYLGSGAGALGLIALIAVWIRRKRQQRYPMLEITQGLDLGEQYALDKDLIRIGAVSQDGGQKNDIVVRDVERMISRFHCQIDKKGGLLYLTDLGSSNGTLLDGKTLTPNQPALLRKGNRISLANVTEFRLGFGRRSKAKV